MYSDLPQHSPAEQVQNGKTITGITPDFAENKSTTAQKRLDKLQGQVIVADILASIEVSWSDDA